MAKSAYTLGVEGALKALAESRDEASLQVWMERNYEELRAKWGDRRMNWIALCAWFDEMGLKNNRGEPATVRGAGLMWQRVGKKIAREKMAQADKPAEGVK